MDPLRSQCTDAQIERLLKAMDLIRLMDREMPAQMAADATGTDEAEPASE